MDGLPYSEKLAEDLLALDRAIGKFSGYLAHARFDSQKANLNQSKEVAKVIRRIIKENGPGTTVSLDDLMKYEQISSVADFRDLRNCIVLLESITEKTYLSSPQDFNESDRLYLVITHKEAERFTEHLS